jgi:hypothetical protein
VKIRIENVRGNYVFVAEPREQLNGEMKYDINGIFTPETKVYILNADKSKTLTTMPAVLDRVATEKWKANGPKIVAALEESKKCYRDGNLKLDKGGNVVEEYEDTTYIVAKNGKPPRLMNQARVEVEDKKQIYNLFYSGAHLDLVVDVYAADREGKGVFATLMGVQHRKDGDVFGGGGRASADDFDEVDIPESAADMV